MKHLKEMKYFIEKKKKKSQIKQPSTLRICLKLGTILEELDLFLWQIAVWYKGTLSGVPEPSLQTMAHCIQPRLTLAPGEQALRAVIVSLSPAWPVSYSLCFSSLVSLFSHSYQFLVLHSFLPLLNVCPYVFYLWPLSAEALFSFHYFALFFLMSST